MAVAPDKVWSTDKINEAVKKYNRTGILPRGVFHSKNISYRAKDVTFEYTHEELLEKAKLMSDIFYFAETYAKIKQTGGYKLAKLRKFQKKALSNLINYRRNIWCASRQIGKSVTMAIFIIHYILSNKDKNIVLLSQNGDKVKDLLEKIMMIYERLPFWMKPGMEEDNVFNKSFDNGCSIKALTTTEKSGASFTADFLYIDEFALIDDNFLEKFWDTAYPTLSSIEDSICVLTSTPRGFNMFHKIYTNAQKGKNDFNPMTTYWYEVPTKVDEAGNEIEYRGEEWKKNEISNMSGEEAFNQEYGCQFLAGNQLLLKSDELRKIKSNELQFVHRKIDELDEYFDEYNFLKWHPKFDLNKLGSPKYKFIHALDLAGGDGGDYSTVNIFQIMPMTRKEIAALPYATDEKDFFKAVQIGILRSNEIAIPELANIYYRLLTELHTEDNIKAVIEMNYDGNWFLSELEKMEGDNNKLEIESIFIQFKHRIDAKNKKTGIKMTEQVKDNSIKRLKDKLRYSQIVPVETTTVDEMLSFSKNDKGKYKAQTGHDDTVMTIVALAKATETSDYADMIDELLIDTSPEFSDLIHGILKTKSVPEDEWEEDDDDDEPKMTAKEKRDMDREIGDLLGLL